MSSTPVRTKWSRLPSGRALLPLLALPFATLLMAPGGHTCGTCSMQKIIRVRADTDWQEVQLAPHRNYAAQLVSLQGASTMRLFALDPDAPLRDTHCDGDGQTFTSCEFESTGGGALGIEVSPSTRAAEVWLDVAPID